MGDILPIHPSGPVVAELDDQVDGFLDPIQHQVVVERFHRRRGIARRLIAYAEP